MKHSSCSSWGAVAAPRKGLSASSRVSTDRAGTSRISMSG